MVRFDFRLGLQWALFGRFVAAEVNKVIYRVSLDRSRMGHAAATRI